MKNLNDAFDRDDTSTDPPGLSTLPRAVSARELATMEIPPPVQIVKGVIDKGTEVILVGRSKIGKSFFALTLALCCALGKDFFNLIIPERRKVLIVNLELREWFIRLRLQRALEALSFAGSLADIDTLHFLNLRDSHFETDELIALIIEEAKNIGADLVVIDPVYLLLSGDENRADDVREAIKSMKGMMADAGAAVLYVHHDKKTNYEAESDNINRGSGSGVFGRHWDFQITLSQHKDRGGVIVVHCYNRDYGDIPAFTVELRDGALHACELEPEVRTQRTDKQRAPSHQLRSEYINSAIQFFERELSKDDVMEIRQTLLVAALRPSFPISDYAAKKILDELIGQPLSQGRRICRYERGKAFFWSAEASKK